MNSQRPQADDIRRPPPEGVEQIGRATFAQARAVSPQRTTRQRAENVADFYASLRPVDLAGLESIYAADATFKDPFNQIQGIASIRRIFEHMFASVQTPRFVILGIVAEGDRAVLTWDFHFMRSGAPMRIHGASMLMFDTTGLIQQHRDYWDAAEELYEHLPVLGPLLRWIKRRLSARAVA